MKAKPLKIKPMVTSLRKSQRRGGRVLECHGRPCPGDRDQPRVHLHPTATALSLRWESEKALNHQGDCGQCQSQPGEVLPSLSSERIAPGHPQSSDWRTRRGSLLRSPRLHHAPLEGQYQPRTIEAAGFEIA